MSDYIFSSVQQNAGFLLEQIQGSYQSQAPEVLEYHGDWGSLAVSVNHYNGFLPYENDHHLLIVIGGPLLCFTDNLFLTRADSNQGTEEIYKRWLDDKSMQWDEDLSGPFTFLLIDKQEKKLEVVTDLMAFIPVYCYQDNGQIFLGTHIDALARACHQESNLDNVALADFVLNHAVTFPYTIYKNIKQLYPSSIIEASAATLRQKYYWLPKEEGKFNSLNEAADYLRNGISGFVNEVTGNISEVAHFISAGEDSRSLAGFIPQKLRRNAYIFLDHMNREGEIAKKVAGAYGAEFNIGYRSPTHYLDILPEAADLVGNGHQYTHAHSLGFDKEFELAKYTAVFGGYLSDSLLKGVYARKIKVLGRFPFLPDHYLCKETRSNPVASGFVKKELLNEIDKRRKEHLSVVQGFRKKTQHEWFVLWPATMRIAIPNLYSTRRLFKSYEPFMCKEAVKVSAGVPIGWKLNRRLFNKAMKPYLKSSKWLLHADGRFPYFSWWVNMPVQFTIWSYRNIARRIGLIKGNQGPWGDWGYLLSSPQWRQAVKDYASENSRLINRISDQSLSEIMMDPKVSNAQKINIIQLLYGTKESCFEH